MAEQTTMAMATGRAGERGFTLAEMLAALGILLFGVTALLGSLSASVAQRRTTDARHAAAALADRIVHRVQHEAMRRRDGAETDFDLELAALPDQVAAEFPGMTWTARAVADETRPDVWLLRLEVRWFEAGETAVQEFLRIVPRQLPLAQRVRRFRAQSPDSAR